MVHTGVESLFDEFDQPRGYKVIIVHRLGIIPNGGWIAHHDEHIADAQRVRGKQVTLDA
jgi:hypothetical protein